MQLQTDELTLRPLKSVDILPFAEAVSASYAELSPWLDWCHEKFSAEEAQDWIQENQLAWQYGVSFEWGIFHKETDAFLGCVYFHHIDAQTHSAQLGYWIDSRFHQQGWAKKAILCALNWAWEEWRWVRIEIVCHPDNHASQAVAKSCGAQFEGIARNKIYLRETPLDGTVYGLIPQTKSLS